jgi:pyruvate dehydrogenase E1 component alpha subunit
MNKEIMIDLYERMLTIRLLEDRLQAMCDRGEAGDLHFNKGQEAIAVGVCEALRPTDHIVTHHRTIAHQVAKGAKLYPLVAELLGRRTGTNGGRAGEMHISDRKIRHDFSFQLVGTCIPVAAGLAWALKNFQRKVGSSDEIVAVFFGDASTSNGQFHEGLNIAAIHKVPLLLICENNHLAGNIRPAYYMSGTMSQKATAYGIQSMTVDGNDVEAVMTAVRSVRDHVQVNGPFLIECDTTRNCWHKQGQRDVRPKEELDHLALRDPLLALRSKLPEDVDQEMIESTVNFKLDEAFKQALNDSAPEVFID